jgi:hypothetical protein
MAKNFYNISASKPMNGKGRKNSYFVGEFMPIGT